MNARQRRTRSRWLRAHFTGISHAITHPFARSLGPGWRLMCDPLADLIIALHREGAWVALHAGLFHEPWIAPWWDNLATALRGAEGWHGEFRVLVERGDAVTFALYRRGPSPTGSLVLA